MVLNHNVVSYPKLYVHATPTKQKIRLILQWWHLIPIKFDVNKY